MTKLAPDSKVQQAANVPVEDLLATSSQFPAGPLRVDMIGANAATAYYRHRGGDARLSSMDAVITAPLDADATITVAVEGVDVGVLTFPALGSGAGEAVLLGLAAVVLTAGDRVRLTVGGANTLASFGDCTLALERVVEVEAP